MRLTKMFGLAALAAVAAMAMVGATSASALTNTQLCNSHTALTCGAGQGATSVKMLLEAGTVGKLLNSLATVLCLQVHGTGTPLALAKPQLIHILEMSFLECGTNSSHANCEVTMLELPLTLLLKTGLDEGTLTFDSGQALVFCKDVFFGIDVHCIYDMAGTSFAVGGQKLTSNKVPVEELDELSLCPDESTLDGTMVTPAGESRYVLQ